MRTVAQFICKQKRFYRENIVILPTDIKGDFGTDNLGYFMSNMELMMQKKCKNQRTLDRREHKLEKIGNY